MSRDSPTLNDLYGPGAEEADSVAELQSSILEEILTERIRQGAIGAEQCNTRNDWVSITAAYLGRAAGRVNKNEKQGELFRDNMLKVAALALASIEDEDRRGIKT